MTGDLITKKGFGAFGCRLRRLSERLDRDIRDIYQDNGIYFDPVWFPVVLVLSEVGPSSLTEIAVRTGMSAQSLSAARSRLHAEGLIALDIDPKDHRRQRLTLTEKGRIQIQNLYRLWDAITRATQGLCAETSPELLPILETVEVALSRRGMLQRVSALMASKA